VLLTSIGLFEIARRHFAAEWGRVQEEIEREIKRREALA
jgi:branched-chain amino acid transport system permease protein